MSFLLEVVPWYISYEDLCKFLDTAESHGGSNVAANYEIIEILSSMIARSVDNRKVYIRNTIEAKEDVDKENRVHTFVFCYVCRHRHCKQAYRGIYGRRHH